MISISRSLRPYIKDILLNKQHGYKRGIKYFFAGFIPLYKSLRFTHQTYRTLQKQQLEKPVLSVGNISLGGTGKTQFSIWLARNLQNRGFTSAILKRGEGTQPGNLAPGNTGNLRSTAREYGDEVAVIRSEVPEVPIGVGADRYNSGTTIEQEFDVDCFILDDGFQYTCLNRDIDIVLLSSLDELEQWELPAGPLREPPSSIDRADFISVNRSPSNKKMNTDHPQLATRQCLSHHYEFSHIEKNSTDATREYKRFPVDVVTTLAQPERLIEFLQNHRFTIGNHIAKSDHAILNWETLSEEIDPDKLLVTPKEWVKLPSSVKQSVGVIQSRLQVEVPDGFWTKLTHCIENKSPGEEAYNK